MKKNDLLGGIVVILFALTIPIAIVCTAVNLVLTVILLLSK